MSGVYGVILVYWKSRAFRKTRIEKNATKIIWAFCLLVWCLNQEELEYRV